MPEGRLQKTRAAYPEMGAENQVAELEIVSRGYERAFQNASPLVVGAGQSGRTVTVTVSDPYSRINPADWYWPEMVPDAERPWRLVFSCGELAFVDSDLLATAIQEDRVVVGDPWARYRRVMRRLESKH